MRTRRRQHRGGFTLLEVIAAVIIASVIVLSLYSSVRIAFKTRSRLNESVDAHRFVQSTIERIRADIVGIAPADGVLFDTFEGTNEIGSGGSNADSLRFVTNADSGSISYDDLDLSSRGMAAYDDRDEGSVSADVYEVEYVVERIDGTDRLLRRVTRNLLAQVEVEPEEQVLAPDVRELNFRYYDGTDWYDEWDSTQRDNGLPLAIEVRLNVAHNDRTQPAFTLVRIDVGSVETEGNTIVR